MAWGQRGVLGNHTELFLARKGLFADLVPALVELTFVFVGPFFGDVVWSMRRAWSKVDEERLVGHQRLLLTNPGDCFVGHVSHEVIALVRGLVGLDRNGPLVKRGVPLICFTADEPIEIFESATAGGPCIE